MKVSDVPVLTLWDRRTDVGFELVQPDRDEDLFDIVERSGYRTVEQQVRDIQLAGERLDAAREEMYPEQVTPVFLDKLDAEQRLIALRGKVKADLAEAQKKLLEEAAAKRKADFEQLVEAEAQKRFDVLRKADKPGTVEAAP